MKDAIKGWARGYDLWTWEPSHMRGMIFAIRYLDLHEMMSEEECKAGGYGRHEFELRVLDLVYLSPERLDDALRSCDLVYNRDSGEVVDHRGVVLGAGASLNEVLAEACITYGYGAPLDSFQGDAHPERLRAEAVREAKRYAKDAEALRERLLRIVNLIGSTASEYGLGDLRAAGLRAREAGRHFRPQVCPFLIVTPEHYMEDGSCRCGDITHRAKMVREWGYDPEAIVKAISATEAKSA